MLDGTCPLSNDEIELLKVRVDDELQCKAIQSIYESKSAFSTIEKSTIAEVLKRTILHDPDERDLGTVEELWGIKDGNSTM